jgi:uncharacterized protein (TIGR01244 family)
MSLRFRRVTPDLSYAPQFSPASHEEIKSNFAAVLNLRSRLERDYDAEEEAAVTALGLAYKNIEWNEANDINEHMAQEIFDALDSLPKPLLVHCRVGYTAAFVVLIRACVDNSVPMSECLRLGMEAGYDFTQFPNMYRILKMAFEGPPAAAS